HARARRRYPRRAAGRRLRAPRSARPGARQGPSRRTRSYRSHLARPLRGAREEVVDLSPEVVAALEAAPRLPDTPNQLVRRIDRHDEPLDELVAPPHEDGFDVRSQCAERRNGGDEFIPRVERQLGFRRAGGTWIER